MLEESFYLLKWNQIFTMWAYLYTLIVSKYGVVKLSNWQNSFVALSRLLSTKSNRIQGLGGEN